MARDIFIQIKRYLHFSDDTNKAASGRPRPQEKLQKDGFILDHLRNAFQKEYVPTGR